MLEAFPDPLISATQLGHLLARAPAERPALLDVRWVVGKPALRAEYLAGHIPGAQWCDLDLDLAAPAGAGGRHPLPQPERLQAAVTRWGIGPEQSVVVYDGGSGLAAARAWWVLRWAGLPDVRVLDGGLDAWLASDGELESGERLPAPGTATVRAGQLPTLEPDQVLELAGAGRLVDVRAPERFAGAQEPLDPVAGHIPGAVNRPLTGNFAPSGGLLDPAELRARFADLPISAGPLGVYCGSGVTACHTVLALQRAGVAAVLYPGSWSGWITDASRPVATG